MKKILCFWALISVSLGGFAEVPAQLLSITCVSCHGNDGQAIPDLKNLATNDIEKALLDFKYDRRFSTVMSRIAKGFDDAELKVIAQNFHRQGK